MRKRLSKLAGRSIQRVWLRGATVDNYQIIRNRQSIAYQVNAS